jgi:hypothetical protein
MNLIEILENKKVIAIFYDIDGIAAHNLCRTHNSLVLDIADMWGYQIVALEKVGA